MARARHSRRRRRLIGGSVAAVVVMAASTLVLGRVVDDRRLTGDVEALLAARRESSPALVTEADLAGLPEPVRRWLRGAGVVGRERPRTVRLKQEGEFRLGEGRGWMPFTAEEYYTVDPPGYVWTVTMRMATVLPIRGRDQYRDGEGSIQMRLLSLVPVADQRGGGLNQGALLRFLNETMWFPAAVLSPYITWEAIDAHAARATMTWAGAAASATFLFDDEGRLTDMQADRFDNATGAVQRWSTPISAYGEFGGIRMPVAGEGIWRYAGGDFAYIRLRITDVEYNRPARY